MKVLEVPIGKVLPYARNPRVNDGAATAKVAASLREFGWQQPLVVDKDFVLIVGHTRHKAAHQLGMTTVPVVVAKDLSPAKVAAYRIADNRTGEEATWNQELLSLELGDLRVAVGGNDLDAVLGFDPKELEQFSSGIPDPSGEWSGMPDFDQPDVTAWRTIHVHFASQAALDDFARLLGQTVTDKTRFLWHPKAEIETYVDKRYSAEASAGEP